MEIHEQELAHMHLVRECILKLGADPTTMTPSADVAGTQSIGLIQSVNDPRFALHDVLQSALIAELTDNAGWELLAELADGLGQDTMAKSFREALAVEAGHLADVKAWVSSRVLSEAHHDLEPAPAPHS